MKYVKRYILVLCLSLAPVLAMAQFERPPQSSSVLNGNISSIYGEIFGNGYAYSLNYDFIHHQNLGFRLGFTPAFNLGLDENNPVRNNDDENSQTFQIIVMGNYFLGSGMHRLELGAGTIFGFSDQNTNLILPKYPAFTSTFGYRMFPPNNRFTLKAAFTPIVSEGKLIPLVGFSFGPYFSN